MVRKQTLYRSIRDESFYFFLSGRRMTVSLKFISNVIRQISLVMSRRVKLTFIRRTRKICQTCDHLFGKLLFTWLSLVMSMMVSFVLSFFPRDVLDEILNLI